MTNKLPAAGTSFHVLSALSFAITAHQSVAASRGQTYVITAEMISANTDRRGDCWLSILDDEEAQVARWGQVKVAPGECPESITWWNGDSATHSLARTMARESVIANVKDPVTKAEKMAAIDEKYGRPMTSQSIDYLA